MNAPDSGRDEMRARLVAHHPKILRWGEVVDLLLSAVEREQWADLDEFLEPGRIGADLDDPGAIEDPEFDADRFLEAFQDDRYQRLNRLGKYANEEPAGAPSPGPGA